MGWKDEVYAPEIKQFASVVFGNVKPTSTVGFNYSLYGGRDYYCDFIEKIKFYKNGKAVIYFMTEDDCKNFAEAIFADPKELLEKVIPKNN